MVRALLFLAWLAMVCSKTWAGPITEQPRGSSFASQVPEKQESEYTGVWYKLCAELPTKNRKEAGPGHDVIGITKSRKCFAVGDLVYPAGVFHFGKIIVTDIDRDGRAVLLVLLGLPATNPTSIRVDDKILLTPKSLGCDQRGCYNAASIDAAAIDTLKGRRKLECLLLNMDESVTVLEGHLDGFREAFEGKPTDVSKYNSEQRNIIEMLDYILMSGVPY